jgi:hypothetical protein
LYPYGFSSFKNAWSRATYLHLHGVRVVACQLQEQLKGGEEKGLTKLYYNLEGSFLILKSIW